MPYTFNGCGTRFYGKRDKGEDGSYVVTEWIAFVYIPLIPIRSLRVLPVGGGTNVIVYSSRNYRTIRVPLSWPQVRNTYLFTAPIIVLIIALSWSDLKDLVKNDLLGAKAPPIKVEAAPVEQPLDNASSAKACGNVLKLEAQNLTKLNIHERMSNLVKASNFTDEEFKNISKPEDVEETAFSGYALGYVTWDKVADPIRNGLIQKMGNRINTSATNLSANDAAVVKAYGNKTVQMVTTAFDMGRHDGRTSPCPF
jgi:hypothetical protein